jgi:hypothetical protein
MAGIMRALATPGSPAPARALRVARRLPPAVRGDRHHLAAVCEVAQMLTDRLGLPASVSSLFVGFTERCDGKGDSGGVGGDEIAQFPEAETPRRSPNATAGRRRDHGSRRRLRA